MSDYTTTHSTIDEVLNFLLSAPSPEQIVAFHASESAQARIRYLLDANRNGLLTDSERLELDEASQLNHLIILLKAKARKALADS